MLHSQALEMRPLWFAGTFFNFFYLLHQRSHARDWRLAYRLFWRKQNLSHHSLLFYITNLYRRTRLTTHPAIKNVTILKNPYCWRLVQNITSIKLQTWGVRPISIKKDSFSNIVNLVRQTYFSIGDLSHNVHYTKCNIYFYSQFFVFWGYVASFSTIDFELN